MTHRVRGLYEAQKHIFVEFNILRAVSGFLINLMLSTLRITKLIT